MKICHGISVNHRTSMMILNVCLVYLFRLVFALSRYIKSYHLGESEVAHATEMVSSVPSPSPLSGGCN